MIRPGPSLPWPSTRRSAVRRLPALLLIPVLALGSAGCGTAPAPSISPEPSVSPAPSEAGIEPAVCRIEQAPRPGDGPPAAIVKGQGLADAGPGRWRMCLADGAEPIEGSAWCSWNDDRSAVTQLEGQPVDAGQDRIQLSLTTRDGTIAVIVERGLQSVAYRQPGGPVALAAADGWHDGAANFELDRREEPSAPPDHRPGHLAGVLRWMCGEPPAPRPGRSTGDVVMRLDAPIDQDVRTVASCDWVTTPVGPRVTAVITSPLDVVLNERFVGIDVRPRDDRPELAIWVDEHDEGAHYAGYGEENVFLITQPADRSSGTARLRRLPIDEGTDVRLVPGADTLSGVISWTCRPPLAPGAAVEVVPGARDPIVLDPVRPTTPGTVRLSFAPAVAGPIVGSVTCALDRSDPAYLRVDTLTGTFDAAGRRFDLRSAGESVLIVMVDPSTRSPLGEYSGAVTRYSDQADRPPLLLDVPELMFEPEDPAFVPLGGVAAPRTVGLTVDYSCDLSALPPA